MDLFGAEPLVGVAELERIFLAFLCAVLGVAQDGAAQVGAVEPKLVGPARQGLQLHQGMALKAGQYPAAGLGGLAGGGDVTQEAGQGAARRGAGGGWAGGGGEGGRLGGGRRSMGASMMPSSMGNAPKHRAW